MTELTIKYLAIDDLKPYERNARKHDEDDILAIMHSISEFGFDDPVGIWSDDNIIVEGHGRVLAAQRLGMKQIPCIRLDHLTDEQRRAYALAHNRTAELSAWNFIVRDEELQGIKEIDMSQFGFDVSEIPVEPVGDLRQRSLSDRFLVPPFSVLRGNSGEWAERKKAWIAKGIHSEVGRGGTCVSTPRIHGKTVTADEGHLNGNAVQDKADD